MADDKIVPITPRSPLMEIPEYDIAALETAWREGMARGLAKTAEIEGAMAKLVLMLAESSEGGPAKPDPGDGDPAANAQPHDAEAE